MLFKKIIAVYCDNHMIPVKAELGLLIWKAGATYIYHIEVSIN
jgi:hypothetical protein